MALKILSSTRTEALCPYCRSSLFQSIDIAGCSSCKTLHHRNCFEELKRCSVFGCDGKPEVTKTIQSRIMIPHGTSSAPFVALAISTVLTLFLSFAFPHWLLSLTQVILSLFGIGLLMKIKGFMSGSAFLATLLFLIIPCWPESHSISGMLSAFLSIGILIVSATRMMLCPRCGQVRRTEGQDGLLQCPECNARFAS